MDLGVCMAAKIDDLDYVDLCEELGFSHLWVADSQMIWSDCYAVLALAAQRTSRIQLGTGVSVAGTRTAPVTAASMATVNALAPGRTFCGIGTGNTAMRIMGHKPLKLADFEDYLRVLRGLMDGEEVDFTWRGKTSPIRHLMPEHGFVNLADRIPMYVSAFGPKAMAIAARHGDGLVTSVPPVPEAVEAAWKRLEAAGAEVGRTIGPDNYLMASLTTMLVLEDGESLDSERVRRQTGAFAIAALHYTYDQWRQYGREPGPHLRDVWDDYAAMLEEVPEERRHQRIHAGHNCWVLPEEERFVTADLIDRTCLVGTAEELADRLRALDAAGLGQIMILPPLAPKEAVLRDVATKVMPLL